MNYWEEKPDFWKNKTTGNPVYKAQKKELLIDIAEIIRREKIELVLDVGGYDGYVGRKLHEMEIPVEYVSLDYKTGVELQKPWREQKDFPKGKKTLAITSLTLISFPPEQITAVLNEIYANSDVRYFFEQSKPEVGDGGQIDPHYGGKWNYDWARLLNPRHKVEIKPSAVNPAGWVRIFEI